MKLFRFFAFVLFCGILGEGTLRLMQPGELQYYRDVKLLHRYHPEYGVSLEKNMKTYLRHHAGLWEGWFSTNSLGHRATREMEPNTPKILCLGDSLVMGFGVSDEDSFCSQLDNWVWKGERFQSVNLGVDAYGSLGYYKRLKEQLPLIPNPKTVLLFISPNDFTMPEAILRQGILPDDETDALHENDEAWQKKFQLQFQLTQASYLLQALKLATEEAKIAIMLGLVSLESLPTKFTTQAFFSYWEDSFLAPRPGTCSQTIPRVQICPESLENQGFGCPRESSPDPKTLPPLPPVTIQAYEKILGLQSAYKFQLIPVFVPGQVEELYCQNLGRYHPLGDYAVRARDFFEKRGVRTISLLSHAPKMCRLSPEPVGIRDHFLPGDGHLTKLGNLWVKEALQAELLRGDF